MHLHTHKPCDGAGRIGSDNQRSAVRAGCAQARVEVETVGRASEQAGTTNASGVFYHVWMQVSVVRNCNVPCDHQRASDAESCRDISEMDSSLLATTTSRLQSAYCGTLDCILIAGSDPVH